MSKGLGIAALVLAVAGWLFPFGFFVSLIGVLIAIAAALAGDRIFAIAVPIVAAANMIVSPSFWVMYAQSSAPAMWLLFAFTAAPIVIVIVMAARVQSAEERQL
jgi:hypothetical protein